MAEDRKNQPESPTAIAMATGLGVPGLVGMEGTLGEAAGFRPAQFLDVVPGQSGAEGAAELPHAGANDPWDGP